MMLTREKSNPILKFGTNHNYFTRNRFLPSVVQLYYIQENPLLPVLVFFFFFQKFPSSLHNIGLTIISLFVYRLKKFVIM